MMYDYTGYPGTGVCWHGDNTERCNNNQIYVAKCVTGEPRQWFTFVNAGTSMYQGNPVEEVLIKLGDTQSSRCFERDEREIWLEFCDPSNPRQRWFALNGGFNEYRFELSQVNYDHQCITNDHHPKSGTFYQFYVLV